MSPSSRAHAPALYALQADGAAEDWAISLEVCRDRGFLGVGWGVGSEPLDWPSYEQRAIERDGIVHGAVREIYDLPDGALIWTRDPVHGVYYLAKVVGSWRHGHGQDAESCGMHNVRPVEMVACESPSQVPATIAGCFVGGWVIQRIYDDHAARRSAVLFDELTGALDEPRPTLDEVLTSFLCDREVQDLACLYLQRRYGFLVRPTARRPGIAEWEAVLRDGYGREAIVRARRGGSVVPRDAAVLPTDAVDQVFVFSPTGTYGPDPAPNVTELDYYDIIDFMRNDRSILPRSLDHWVSRALDDVPARAG